MRNALTAVALLALAGCGSNAPQPAPSDESLGSVMEEVARPSDPMGTASEAPAPQATGGGAAVQ